MCLYTNYKTPSIAEVDIICYKIYIFYNKSYSSPFQRAKMPLLNELATTELDYDTHFVERGFHSFVNLSDAKKEARELEAYYIYKHYVFKCIIPKGTQYYIGYYGDKESYCSKSIIVKEYLDKDNLI